MNPVTRSFGLRRPPRSPVNSVTSERSGPGARGCLTFRFIGIAQVRHLLDSCVHASIRLPGQPARSVTYNGAEASFKAALTWEEGNHVAKEWKCARARALDGAAGIKTVTEVSLRGPAGHKQGATSSVLLTGELLSTPSIRFQERTGRKQGGLTTIMCGAVNRGAFLGNPSLSSLRSEGDRVAPCLATGNIHVFPHAG